MRLQLQRLIAVLVLGRRDLSERACLHQYNVGRVHRPLRQVHDYARRAVRIVCLLRAVRIESFEASRLRPRKSRNVCAQSSLFLRESDSGGSPLPRRHSTASSSAECSPERDIT